VVPIVNTLAGIRQFRTWRDGDNQRAFRVRTQFTEIVARREITDFMCLGKRGSDHASVPTSLNRTHPSIRRLH
jgi:hypothetical protein